MEQFCEGWKFFRGASDDPVGENFDDRGWRRVDLPHDWSIEDLPARNADPAFLSIPLVPGEWFIPAAPSSAGGQSVWLPDPAGSLSPFLKNGSLTLEKKWTVPPHPSGQKVLVDVGIIDGGVAISIDGQNVLTDTSQGYWSTNSIRPRILELSPQAAGPGEHTLSIHVTPPPHARSIFSPTPRNAEAPTPFDPARSVGGFHTGSTVGGTGWYRKTFELPESSRGKLVRLFFEGAAVEATVWLNGKELVRNHYAYSPFFVDLTPVLRPPGQKNTLTVRVENAGSNSRWYSGSGIFRSVRLETANPISFVPFGTIIRTKSIDNQSATIEFTIESTPDSVDGKVDIQIVNRSGQPVASGSASIANDGSPTRVDVDIASPALWSPETPNLYTAKISLQKSSRTTDQIEESFGVRTLRWSPAEGISLNGQPIKLRGGCIHHDHGPLGAASFPAAESRRVEKLKSLGYNTIRTSHNPVDPEFLKACDRLGLMVIEEAFDMWNQPKNPDDYSRHFSTDSARDLSSMICRDRNHPSIIAWSIGNEIPEQHSPLGASTARTLASLVRKLDPSRPITQAVNGPSVTSDPTFAELDWAGYNYAPEQFGPDHARIPSRFMITTESFPRESFGYWNEVLTKPYVGGDFIWTAWDYLGETAIAHSVRPGESGSYLRGWPNTSAFCGDIDLIGNIKPQSFYRQVLWDVRPAAILIDENSPGQQTAPDKWGWREELPHWNWPKVGEKRTVRVYAKGDAAVLSLNGREIGRQPISKDFQAVFEVPYEPGSLEAKILRNGRTIATEKLETTGPVAALQLVPETQFPPSGKQSIAFVSVAAVDSMGRVVPTADCSVTLSVTGPAHLIAFGNGDIQNTSSVQSPTHRLWRGRALAVFRSNGQPGTIQITAESSTGQQTTRSLEFR